MDDYISTAVSLFILGHRKRYVLQRHRRNVPDAGKISKILELNADWKAKEIGKLMRFAQAIHDECERGMND